MSLPVSWQEMGAEIDLKNPFSGRLGAQSVGRLTLSAQVMISWFMGLSPTSGSLLSAQNLPGILCLPLFLPFPHSCVRFLKK